MTPRTFRKFLLDTVFVTINGVEVARGTGARPDHGPIGWLSEGAPIRFRKVEIREGN